MTTDAIVQVGDLVLFTQAAGRWNRERLYRVAATSEDCISVECDGHRYNIARDDLGRLGFTLAEK